jgi:probable rRNA maturation factor
MITVNFHTKHKFAYPRQKLIKLVKSVCKRFRVSSAIINIAIADNRQIRSLNKKFLRRNTVTDCLSFDLSEKPGLPRFTAEHAKLLAESRFGGAETAEGKKIAYSVERIGDKKKLNAIRYPLSANSAVKKSFEIIVNAQKAKSEGKKRGHSQQAELALYITHGLLHNLGFDDLTVKKAKAMHHLEDEILQQHGFGKVYNSHRVFSHREHRGHRELSC